SGNASVPTSKGWPNRGWRICRRDRQRLAARGHPVRTRAACLFAVGCIALSGCGTGASTVEQQSEAALYYPGSHVIYGSTVPQNVICIDDCHPAGRTVTLEASANAQQIMSWYAAKLRAAGWSLDPYDKGTNPTVRSW